MKRGTTKDRFFAHVMIPTNKDECWTWTGRLTLTGYGLIRNEDGKKESAHRVSYRIHNGEFDSSLWVLHHCDNRKCVNPEHLFLGNRSDNTKDMWNKGRHPTDNMGRPSITMLGEKNPNAELSESDVLRIRELYRNGKTQKFLSVTFGIGAPAIWKIIHGRTWKHIEL